MSAHGGNGRPQTPHWLRAFYAVLIFTAFVVLVSEIIHH